MPLRLAMGGGLHNGSRVILVTRSGRPARIRYVCCLCQATFVEFDGKHASETASDVALWASSFAKTFAIELELCAVSLAQRFRAQVARRLALRRKARAC